MADLSEETRPRRDMPLREGPRPRIAITGSDRGSRFAWLLTRLQLLLAGARCELLTPSRFRSPEGFDGFVIGGGADVEPARYGETMATSLRHERDLGRHPGEALVSIPLYLVQRLLSSSKQPGPETDRDAMEWSCIDHAIRHALPVLGICRGAQLINVYFGGTLFQSLRDFYVETPHVRSFLPRKPVDIYPGTRLAGILGLTRCLVNSLHHQAVKQTGEGLVVCAREPSGVVQAIEHAHHEFVIGVQWHPEYLMQRPEQRAIFRALVDAVDKRRAHGPISRE